MAYTDYLKQVQEAYIAYYQRPADPGGLLYWSQRLDNLGGNLDAMIDAFATSEEAQALYGTIDSETIEDVITQIYRTAFNRNPDPEGLQFYVDGFNAGKFTATTIMLNILDGAQGSDQTTLDNKVASAANFTLIVDPELDGQNPVVTYDAGDIPAARAYLQEVDETAQSVRTQKEAADYIREEGIANEGDRFYDYLYATSDDDTLSTTQNDPSAGFLWYVNGLEGTDTLALTITATESAEDGQGFYYNLDGSVENVENLYIHINETAQGGRFVLQNSFYGLKKILLNSDAPSLILDASAASFSEPVTLIGSDAPDYITGGVSGVLSGGGGQDYYDIYANGSMDFIYLSAASEAPVTTTLLVDDAHPDGQRVYGFETVRGFGAEDWIYFAPELGLTPPEAGASFAAKGVYVREDYTSNTVAGEVLESVIGDGVDFFNDGAVDRMFATITLQSPDGGAHDTYLFIDADGDGNFSFENDMGLLFSAPTQELEAADILFG